MTLYQAESNHLNHRAASDWMIVDASHALSRAGGKLFGKCTLFGGCDLQLALG